MPLNSPVRFKTIKHEKILKCMSSNHKEKTILQQRHEKIRVSKSPSAKKTRLFVKQKRTHMTNDNICKGSKICDHTESIKLHCTNSSDYSKFTGESVFKVVISSAIHRTNLMFNGSKT